MTKVCCSKCGRIIVEDWDNYKKKYPEEKSIQCPYCGHIMVIEEEAK
jgi:DNA-directed RNA polymerase subunit RPC12/RpoP